MKHAKRFLLALSGVAVLGLFVSGRAADDDHFGPYRLLTTIPMPGNLAGGFDISWVDTEAGQYYLADRGTTSIDVIDTKNNTFLYPIKLQAAGNGVVAVPRSREDNENNQGNEDDNADRPGELWVGDAQSYVEVVDLETKAVSLPKVPTHGTGRADELAYDPQDHILVVANDRDNPPFLTFIDTKTRTNLGKLPYPQAVFGNPPVNHGIEQPVWDARTRRFYQALPGTLQHPNGEVDEIKPVQTPTGFGEVTHVFPTICSPAGLALVPHQRLVTSCGDVITIKTGAVLHVAGFGGDEIWFNPGDERVYFGNGVSVPVMDTNTFTLLTTLVVGHIAPPPPSQTTHSLAADSENNRIFVPVSNAGVKVYTAARPDDEQ